MNTSKKTRDELIENIKELYKANKLYREYHMQLGGYGQIIYYCNKYFGSYKKAIEEICNVNYKKDIAKLGKYAFDTNIVIETLIKYKKDGYDISSSNMVLLDGGLVSAATKYFGSWTKLLIAANINPDDIVKDFKTATYLGRKFENIAIKLFKIIKPEWIKKKQFFTGKNYLYPDFIQQKYNTWIDIKLSSYSQSINSSIKKYEKYADRLLFIYLYGSKRKNTKKIKYVNIFDYENNNDIRIKNIFIELKTLMNHINDNNKEIIWYNGVWNEKKIIEEIKKLENDKLNKKWLSKNYITLYRNASKIFGSWESALIAADKNIKHCELQRKKYSRDELIIFIKNNFTLENKFLCDSYMKNNNSGIRSAAQHIFGSWRKAIEACGFDYDKVKNIRPKSYKKKV